MAEPEQLVVEAQRQAEAATTLEELSAVRTAVSGKRSPLVAARKELGALDPEARREAGQALNAAKAAIDEILSSCEAELSAAARAEKLSAERLDLTEVTDRPSDGHLHVITQTWQELEDVFVGMGYRVAEGPEIESEWYNFGALNFPLGHPARDMYDTLYVDYGESGSTLLRTHTSPVQARVMENQEPPIYVVAPGRCFRQDTADATHMPVFHQIEGLVVDRDTTLGDLAGTIEAFTAAYFGPGFTSRLRPSYFPFTEPSAEFDIQRPDGTWLELGGCGMVHPNVFKACGIDPEQWQGFAFGFGIDRLALIRFGIDDLRELWTNDVRFLEQF
ncbi:MAG: phenylalanine--tRNA ligase subunit alpha [Acidimicrobiia bacterium]|nr:phenylalanine--tRNA ligase subunit alpha [Acidimicrobiia bacterium]MCY4432643.1 phenylalanine--tRNA ligase subunit alpha [bacterium]